MLLAANGAPYDTLRNAIATAPHALVVARRALRRGRAHGGRRDAISARCAEAVRAERPAVVFVQRSRGYAARRSLSIDAIAALVERRCARRRADAVVFVDNCYGELVEEREPLEAGADVIAGSLIKNIGGGLAPAGGYLAGTRRAHRAHRRARVRAGDRRRARADARLRAHARAGIVLRAARRGRSAARPRLRRRAVRRARVRGRSGAGRRCAPTSCRRFGSARASA